MQQFITQARPYAVAAFEHAQEEGKLAEWSGVLHILNLLVSDPQVKQVLDNPRVSNEALSDFVTDVCGDRLTDSGKKFVKLLIDAGRLSLAPYIFKLFEKNRAKAEGLVEVEVVSAFPVDSGEKEKLAGIMGKRLGKKIEINTRVDESLIGGVIIRAGDSVIDASIKGRLKQLSNRLTD
ncbi:MAG: F0F1 ATP synthase subunit delta [Gammaproteobacteria bacterium]|nr:F0F1 ATP synthase subunit delta [Gammaproteobacteria bacterium]NIO61624.1 F0F1 ATP synthase subunit delta [Gammaproteobacteria bacterium]NIQ18875.1 F0F1 ATP synthase subunit delta [Gammaproteobacteria bacterium]NIT04924.1 F0F1 ATP synthase subunit delta [Gammaproteobacteria bacterium]NIT40297.1 F0F1 ATP synthase subunit delta [Gammaproteobacteria bacterium]